MKYLTLQTTFSRAVLMSAVLLGLAGCGSSAHRTPTAGADLPSTAKTPDLGECAGAIAQPGELKRRASDAAEVCAAWHDFYRYMTANPPARNLAIQSMTTMSLDSLGVSAGNPQFPSMQNDVYQLMAAAAANPLQPINSDMPGVAGLQAQCP